MNPYIAYRLECPSPKTALQTSCIPLATDSTLLGFMQDGGRAECYLRVPATSTIVTGTVTAICTDLTLTIPALVAAPAPSPASAGGKGKGKGSGKGAEGAEEDVVVFQEGWVPRAPLMPEASRKAWLAWAAQVKAAWTGAGGGPDRKGPGAEEEVAVVKKGGRKGRKSVENEEEEVVKEKKKDDAKAKEDAKEAVPAVVAPAPPAPVVNKPAPDPLAGARLAGPRAMVVTSSESMRP